jgi:hypothetical protein
VSCAHSAEEGFLLQRLLQKELCYHSNLYLQNNSIIDILALYSSFDQVSIKYSYKFSTMPSPFHQKYSSQSHKIFGDNTVPAMPEGPKETNDRRASDSSINSNPPSPTDARRRVSYSMQAELR